MINTPAGPAAQRRQRGRSQLVPTFLFFWIILHHLHTSSTRAQNDDTLQLNIYTPLDDGYADVGIVSWISLLASSLLGQDTPGFFYGAVPAATVESACQMVENGYQSIPATVTAYGSTVNWNLQVQAIGGCDASTYSPMGVEMVFTDDTGRTNVIICDDNTWTIGCSLYNTGDDVNSIYEQPPYHSSVTIHNIDSDTSTTSMNRSMQLARGGLSNMDSVSPYCTLEGFSSGAIFGLSAVPFTCIEAGVLAPFCAIAVVAATAIAGAAARCSADAIASKAGTSCFPGNSVLTTSTGYHKKMHDLSIGDQVAVWNNNGKELEFSHVYGFGHADANISSRFLHFKLSYDQDIFANKRVMDLELSPLHFAIVLDNDQLFRYKYAKEVVIGDKMLVWDQNKTQFITYMVIDIHYTIGKGLYNPYTLQGTIIVGDVVISVHSDWFLDTMFHHLAMAHLLPSTYQFILGLPRAFYRLFGKDIYSTLYYAIESSIGIPTFILTYGGGISLLSSIFTMSTILKIFRIFGI